MPQRTLPQDYFCPANPKERSPKEATRRLPRLQAETSTHVREMRMFFAERMNVAWKYGWLSATQTLRSSGQVLKRKVRASQTRETFLILPTDL
jgi:hypothetical protein